MNVVSLGIPDVKLIHPDFFEDERGRFCETYSWRRYKDHGIDADFVQDNQSLSLGKGTLRGLHYQSPPHGQGKLVRVVKGRIFDVAVDVRTGSPNYGQSVSAELDASSGAQIWVPEGFLHGFLTLEDNTEVAYKTTNYYDAESDGTVMWNDPDLSINWGHSSGNIIVSSKDNSGTNFADFKSPFRYEGA